MGRLTEATASSRGILPVPPRAMDTIDGLPEVLAEVMTQFNPEMLDRRAFGV